MGGWVRLGKHEPRAQEMSERKHTGHVRRAKRILQLRNSLRRAQWIVEWVDEQPTRWNRLSVSDQNLYETVQQIENELQNVLDTPAGLYYEGCGSHIGQTMLSTGNP